MKISRILVPAVALMVTNNYVTTAVTIETCNSGLASCLEKCEMFGGVLPGGELLCVAGCGTVYAGCLALCS